ncbi:hypothetical protein NSQ62_11575 [Solibacillus sp. FSL H8-0523]|uniref:hypothetical protein n=1 Tax=Solibacillus sp. FSL H8-0523 TaxID=2954511 RepID=UPI00310137C4
MLVMVVRFLHNKNGRRKTDVTCIVFDDINAKVTTEMQLAKLHEMGIDAIEILKSRPKAEVLEVSYDETNRQ